MLRHFLATSPRLAPTLARLALALVLLPHGAQHLFGWFGGYGFAATHAWMTGTLGIPSALAALAIVTEFAAPLALLVGFAGRAAAAGLGVLMAVAASTHAPNGFFMNWFGGLAPGQEGFEYHVLAIALAALVVIEGSGRFSLDRALGRGVPA